MYIFVPLLTTFLDKLSIWSHFPEQSWNCRGWCIKCKRQINDTQRKHQVVKSHWGCWWQLGNLIYTHFTPRKRHCMKHGQGQESGWRQFNTTQGVCAHQQPYRSISKVLFVVLKFYDAKVSIINSRRKTRKDGANHHKRWSVPRLICK